MQFRLQFETWLAFCHTETFMQLNVSNTPLPYMARPIMLIIKTWPAYPQASSNGSTSATAAQIQRELVAGSRPSTAASSSDGRMYVH